MNFSLPVIVSDRVGCAADLVQEDGNGFVFPSGDIAGLADALRKVVISQALRATFGRKSREIIAEYNISAVCEQTVQACLSVVGGNLTPSTERKEKIRGGAIIVSQSFESARREVLGSDE
jgi:glycosyltransferase involved in cell wall biosynthesis